MTETDRLMDVVFIFLILITGVAGVIFINRIGKSEEQREEYHYPVEYYRYFETEASLFVPRRQAVEVIYKTDSDSVKRTFFTSDIKIGKQTEVIVYRTENWCDNFALFMTKDDYECLFKQLDDTSVSN